MAIILDDVQRLDRLITDISDASRLDAELSRLELEPIDIGRDAARARRCARGDGDREAPRSCSTLDSPHRGRELIVPGIESRLSQVFRNVHRQRRLVQPARRRQSACTARMTARAVLVTVEDEGPGIPEDKLTAIFDRFYTERPAGEKFGTHSGLGLSISKQIVEAHRGRIWAENRRDAEGAVFGARFRSACRRRRREPGVSATLLVHATAVAIDGRAVLLRGPSGSGKSDLALRLIDAGAAWSRTIRAVRRGGGTPSWYARRRRSPG